jgi:branched-chain amino acid transport system permease protein
LLGLVAAVALPAAVGAVLALVVIRLRGLYLALATLAFAYAMDNLFFNKVLGYGGILAVGRFGARSEKPFLIEASIVLAVLAVGLLALKRGPFGRRLAALNDSEAACASIGLNLTRTKVAAFTIAAAIAGLGGALYGGWQGEVSPNDFPMLKSLILLILITLGGVRTVVGALAAAMFYAFQNVIQDYVHIPSITYLLVGLGAISLGKNPAGFAGQVGDAFAMIRTALARRSPGQSVLIPAQLRDDVDETREVVTVSATSEDREHSLALD